MKTLLVTALTFTGIALCTTEARDRGDRDRYDDRDSYRSERRSFGCERPSFGYRVYRRECEPRRDYYYREEPRYYRPAPRYYESERCEPERRHFRPPLFSFLFGF